MKRQIQIAIPVAAAALAAAGLVGGAQAQLPGSSSDNGNSITVNGVGAGGTVSKSSGVADRKSSYATALNAAMADAKSKANSIAEAAGTSVTGVSSVTENTSAASCGKPATKTTCTVRATVTVAYSIP